MSSVSPTLCKVSKKFHSQNFMTDGGTDRPNKNNMSGEGRHNKVMGIVNQWHIEPSYLKTGYAVYRDILLQKFLITIPMAAILVNCNPLMQFSTSYNICKISNL